MPDGPPERAPSLPPHSPSIASPGPEQVHCAAGPGPSPFRLSPADKYPSFSFEEAPASSPGRFLKGGHVPFHPYKRHFQEDIFPEAQTALALDGHAFKTPGVLEAFEEMPVDVGEAEAFLPGFSAEVWCNGLPYSSQEHSPQVLVSTSGQWAAHLSSVPAPSSPDESSEIKLPSSLPRPFHSSSVCIKQAQRLGASRSARKGQAGMEETRWGRQVRLRKLAGSFPVAPESGFQCVTSLCLFKCQESPARQRYTHMQM